MNVSSRSLIKISPVGSLDYRNKAHGETDRQTDGRKDRQNYDSQDSASIAVSRGKNDSFFKHLYLQFFY